MKGFAKPRALSRGEVVGVIAPSDAVDKASLKKNIRLLEDWGLKVILGRHLYSTVGDFAAGTPTERKEDILRMIEDPEVKVIWAAEGGYAATEVLPVFTKEVVERLRLNPKWFIGYSDVCVLLNALTTFKVVNLVGPNLSELFENDERSRTWLRRILFGENSLEIGSEAKWNPMIQGEVTARLLISNLDSLVTLLGTKFDPLMHGLGDLILGLEEWWIDKSTLQRQIDTVLNHKRAGRIKGILLGRFVGVGESGYPVWGKGVTAADLIEGRVRLRGGMPMAQLSDFGHPLTDNWLTQRIPSLKKPYTHLALPNGINAKMAVGNEKVSLILLEAISE